MVVYSKEILDHHQDPRNRGVLEDADRRAKAESPLCGCIDWIEIFLKVKGGRVEDIKFQGEGCVVSIAAASMLTERVKGMSIAEIYKINEDAIRQAFDDSLTSFREKCAFLSLEALRSALGIKEK